MFGSFSGFLPVLFALGVFIALGGFFFWRSRRKLSASVNPFCMAGLGNKVLVPPRFTSLNLRGGTDPPRNGAASTRGPWVPQMASGCLLEQIYLYKHVLALGSLRTARQQEKFASPPIFPARAPGFVLKDKRARQGIELWQLNIKNNTADVFRPRICKYWLLEKFPALNLMEFLSLYNVITPKCRVSSGQKWGGVFYPSVSWAVLVWYWKSPNGEDGRGKGMEHLEVKEERERSSCRGEDEGINKRGFVENCAAESTASR